MLAKHEALRFGSPAIQKPSVGAPAYEPSVGEVELAEGQVVWGYITS